MIDRTNMRFLSYLKRMFTKPKPTKPTIHFRNTKLVRVPTLIDGHYDYDLYIVENWTVSIKDKLYRLIFVEHPNKKLAELNGVPVPTELALLCFESFFDHTNEDKAQKLLTELSKY